MSTSMTKGSPLKLMLQFALPLLMGNLLQQTYNIIDAAIVGQILGADALASVGSWKDIARKKSFSIKRAACWLMGQPQRSW